MNGFHFLGIVLFVALVVIGAPYALSGLDRTIDRLDKARKPPAQ